MELLHIVQNYLEKTFHCGEATLRSKSSSKLIYHVNTKYQDTMLVVFECSLDALLCRVSDMNKQPVFLRSIKWPDEAATAIRRAMDLHPSSRRETND